MITRPEPEASEWAQALRTHGIDARAFPLICIGDAPDHSALEAARGKLPSYRAVLLVSGNAARHFFDPKLASALAPYAQAAIKTRVWAPGPGTARMLTSLGISPERIDQPDADAAQFESESLWARVGRDVGPGDRILIVRGSEAGVQASANGSGRDWLSAQIRAAGGEVDYVAAYTRAAPTFSSDALARAQIAAADGTQWVLSSAQALGHLLAALPEQRWRNACALATHPRIAEAAHAAGFGAVRQCRPALADVVAALAPIEFSA